MLFACNMESSNLTYLTTSKLIKAWIQTSRVPFHLVGVFPFILGGILSRHITGTFHEGIFSIGLAAVILIMLSTYYNGEYHDIIEDRLSAQMERNTFSGGSQAVAQGLVPGRHAKIAGYITAGIACVLGFILQFHYKTGILTIPLGAIGVIAGFFYSKKPFRWVERGFGEMLIGFCYGWLPVAVSFYLQNGSFTNLVHWVSIPVGCTIFNVILINEFPDYPADTIVRKKNLVVRFGKELSSYLYVVASLLSWFFFAFSVRMGIPGIGYALYAPVFFLSLAAVIMVLRKDYLHRLRLQAICAITIVVNLATTLAYILALVL